jgi:hypothetical protein
VTRQEKEGGREGGREGKERRGEEKWKSGKVEKNINEKSGKGINRIKEYVMRKVRFFFVCEFV